MICTGKRLFFKSVCGMLLYTLERIESAVPCHSHSILQMAALLLTRKFLHCNLLMEYLVTICSICMVVLVGHRKVNRKVRTELPYTLPILLFSNFEIWMQKFEWKYTFSNTTCDFRLPTGHKPECVKLCKKPYDIEQLEWYWCWSFAIYSIWTRKHWQWVVTFTWNPH